MPATHPVWDDERADALAARLTAACQGELDAIVIPELIATLAEFIGHFPLHQRDGLVAGAHIHLRQYVSEIPPLPTDAYGGGPDAA
jgi:hypothetical protein